MSRLTVSIESSSGRSCFDRSGIRASLLYVWDQPLEGEIQTVAALRKAGNRVETVATTKFRCRSALRENRLMLVLFDLRTPEGLALCRRLRRNWHGAILVILRGQAATSVMQAFAAGADMCLPAPFHEGELVARVAALVRRCAISRPV